MKDLNPEDWQIISGNIDERHAVLFKQIAKLREQKLEDATSLAAADLFVEKAQHQLTKRGRLLMCAGVGAAVFALVGLIVPGAYLLQADLKTIIGEAPLRGYELTLLLTKTVSATAFLLGAVVFSGGLSRAFFHEGTVLFQRRHALRFGRLFVYLKRGKVALDDLERAFMWNAEFSTAFKDMKPEELSKTVWHRMLEAPPETLRAFSSLVQSTKAGARGGTARTRARARRRKAKAEKEPTQPSQ